MLQAKLILRISVISLLCVSCIQEKGKTQTASNIDSLEIAAMDSEAFAVKDSIEFSFNEENEFLGLGTPQFGDLDSMVDRRIIRALVPYTHLYYRIDLKKRSGIAFEALNLFESSLCKQLKLKPHMVRIIFIPVNRAQVIPLLREGYADLAYAGMNITDERKELVDFSIPSITGLKEIIVGGPKSPKLNSLADLSGKEIYLRKGSSYETAVMKLNDSLLKMGKKPVKIKNVDPYLESEDMLEMLNSGIIPYSAMVEDVAKLWANVMDSLVLYDQFPLATDVSYGMVFRKNSPKLKAAADKFLSQNAKGTKAGNALYKKYVMSEKRLPQVYSEKTYSKMKILKAPFLKYGEKYDLDWLLLVAQGYQESGLNQSAVSHMGAVGIMQVLPSTAAGAPFYIKDISKVDANVHAGVKYMRYLINQWFNDSTMDKLNQHLFALAAYNCGPGRVSSMRKKAAAKGLNPNLWFDNVEIISAREIGKETNMYVSNIYKFYASYRALSYYSAQSGKKVGP